MNWLWLSLWTLWCYVSRVSELLFLSISMIPSVERRQRRLSRFLLFHLPSSSRRLIHRTPHSTQYRAHDRNKSFFYKFMPPIIIIVIQNIIYLHKFFISPTFSQARFPTLFYVRRRSFATFHIQCFNLSCLILFFLSRSYMPQQSLSTSCKTSSPSSTRRLSFARRSFHVIFLFRFFSNLFSISR